jgi:hypothetical protein
MDPRKKSNQPRKSTNLPKEFLDNVRQVFTQGFKKQLKNRPLFVEGRIYTDEILLSVGFRESEKALRQTNFEASIDSNGKDVLKKLETCVDAISSMMSQFFEADEELDLPRKWQGFPFEKETIYLQYSGRNTELEAEANKLLGLKTGDELLIDESEDLLDDDLEDEPTDDDPSDDPSQRN